jgi:hypothetical protein
MSSFGPLGPLAPTVALMDSFSVKLRHRFQRLVSPCISQKVSPRRSWGRGLALIDDTTQRDFWNSIGRVHPLPIKIGETEES